MNGMKVSLIVAVAVIYCAGAGLHPGVACSKFDFKAKTAAQAIVL